MPILRVGNAIVASSSEIGHPSRPQRILACVLCQQRKVKCDRKFPCANCTKQEVLCVPARQARRRRRRFPEQLLLDRLQKYEDLLRQHSVRFEPLLGSLISQDNASAANSDDSGSEQTEVVNSDPNSPADSKRADVGTARNVWMSIVQDVSDSNNHAESRGDSRLETLKRAWDGFPDHADHSILGMRRLDIELVTLHPAPVDILKLWQIYLDNVNALLKVTHTPSLQGRIIEAAGNIGNLDPAIEALMFGMYCIATLSLDAQSCQTIFGSCKDDLLAQYQFGCRQALLNCGFLRSENRDSLTALYLYLVSARGSMDPWSLSGMLSVAIRIARRMGIDDDSGSYGCSVFEREMRRRLWWSLVLFDSRISELSGYKTTQLLPTWNCKIPLNVNDSDLRVDMKETPAPQAKLTDVLFALLRSELGDFVRHTSFHLEFANPLLKPIVKKLPHNGDLDALETRIEQEYLDICDMDNPVHFMTVWTVRGYLAKCRLMENYAKRSKLAEGKRNIDSAIIHALRMLECDTQLTSSPLTSGYSWFLHSHFPFVAYQHILQSLKAQPRSQSTEAAWALMLSNFEVHFGNVETSQHPMFKVFADTILQAWKSLEEELGKSPQPATTPRLVLRIREKLSESDFMETENPGCEEGICQTSTALNDHFATVPVGLQAANAPYGMGIGGFDAELGSSFFSPMFMQGSLMPEFNQLGFMGWEASRSSFP